MRKSLLGLVIAIASIITSFTPAVSVTFPDQTRVLPKAAPYVVSLWTTNTFDDRKSTGFFCTGSLINATTVVTAAHCMFDSEGNFVGMDREFVIVRKQVDRTSYGEVLVPRSVQVHPDYDHVNFKNDLAIIDLVYAANAQSYLKLPTTSQTLTALNTNLRLYGWGLNQNQDYSQFLQSSAQKNANTKATTYYASLYNSEFQLAAYRKATATNYSKACSGDSGGPLVSALNKKQFLVGVVSFGDSENCRTKNPVVYTRVSAYREWIKEQLAFFASDRAAQSFSVLEANFKGTTANPLPISTVRNPDDSTSELTEIRFGSQFINDARSDLVGVNILNYSNGGTGWDVEIQFETQTPITNGCSWSESVYNSIKVNVRDRAKWSTGLQIFVPTNGACLTSTPTPAFLTSVADGPVPAGCMAAAVANAAGGASLLLTNECLPEPQKSYFRFEFGFGGIVDSEPGWDMWAGPVNLSN